MRNTRKVSISSDGRDKGKVFSLTEMPAMQAEKWAIRAFQALSRGGIEIPDYISGAGMAGLAILGLQAISKANFAETEPLMDEMLGCVKIVRDPAKLPDMSFDLIPDDIEEVATLMFLRNEVFDLHTGFSFAGEMQRLISLAQAKKTEEPISDTPTSPAPSEPLSQPDLQPSAN